MQQQSPQYNDEIDLKDLILALWQGKWIIIACVVFALIAAAAYLKLVPQTYKGQITLKAPTNAQMLQLDLGAADEVMAISSETLSTALISQLKENTTVAGKYPNWSIDFASAQPEAVKQFWQEAMPAHITTAHVNLRRQFAKASADNQVQREEGGEAAIQQLEKHIQLAKVAGIDVNTSPSITSQTLPYIRGYKVLQAELAMLKASIAEQEATPEVANPFAEQEITLINYDIANTNLQPKIKPMLLLALSFVLGGMLGVFILIIRNLFKD